MGSTAQDRDREADEQPAHRVLLPAFAIDRDEVTAAQYWGCVLAQKCRPVEDVLDENPAWPVVHVRWTDAADYCRFAQKRLPTEAEWEKSARGTDGRRYPWGDEPRCDAANFGNFAGEGRCPQNAGALVEVGRSAASPYGARDQAGNAGEGVADVYAADDYRQSPAQSPPGPDKGPTRVVRGGACCSMLGLPRAANRLALPPIYDDGDIGFRCALDPAPLRADKRPRLTIEGARHASSTAPSARRRFHVGRDAHARRLGRGHVAVQ